MADADKIDDYELVNCVATGNVTQIWEVKRAGSAQPLAMKLMLDEARADSENRSILKHEANVGKVMHHPNIITVFDVKINRKVAYYTMEYFRSGNLKGLIRNEHSVAQSRAKSLMECLSQALGYFHEKGWIHRDIKPDNVLLNKGGEVRLIDFSLSSKPSNMIVRAVTRKSKVAIQGTRTYLAPELIRREALTPSADIYSLGVLLFEVLIGYPPFRTANPNDLLMMHVRDAVPPPMELDDNITPEANELVLKMLAKKVKERYANMQEVYAQVRNIKFFKEDPVKVARERADTRALSDAQAQEDRLNSRKDASRDKSLDAERPKPKPKKAPVLITEEKPKPAQQPVAAGQPQVGGYPMQPGMMPGYPGMMPGQMPGYPGMMPGYPMQPGMMPPGYPMHPGQMPGYPMPGQMPGYPMQPGQMPGYPMPGMPAGQPGAQFPQPIQPNAPQPAPPPQPAAPKPSAPQGTPSRPLVKHEDIPLASIDDLEIE